MYELFIWLYGVWYVNPTLCSLRSQTGDWKGIRKEKKNVGTL